MKYKTRYRSQHLVRIVNFGFAKIWLSSCPAETSVWECPGQVSGHLWTLRLTPNEVSSGPSGVMWRENGPKRWKNGQNGQYEQISSKKKSGKKDIFEKKN